MKNVQIYECEMCGARYEDRDDCIICEKSHQVVIGVNDMFFQTNRKNENYPERVELKMSNGKMIWYHR